MSSSRALVVVKSNEEKIWEDVTRLWGCYYNLAEARLSQSDIESIPTFREITTNPSFPSACKKFTEINVSELKEQDRAVRNYILERQLEEVADCTTDRQRAREYKQVLNTLKRYKIDAAVYLADLKDVKKRNEAAAIFKAGAASYVKGELAVAFETARLAVDDMHILQSDRARPNDKLESLLRPFDEAMGRGDKKAEWAKMLEVLEDAGYCFDEKGLAEAIAPDNVFTNTMMDFKDAQPA